MEQSEFNMGYAAAWSCAETVYERRLARALGAAAGARFRIAELECALRDAASVLMGRARGRS